MTGTVSDLWEPKVELVIRGRNDASLAVHAVVDTGFGGELLAPRIVIQQFGLAQRGWELVRPADGARVLLPRYRAVVDWHGAPRRAIVLEGENAVLVGMSLLRKHRLTVDVVAGGRVSIEELV